MFLRAGQSIRLPNAESHEAEGRKGWDSGAAATGTAVIEREKACRNRRRQNAAKSAAELDERAGQKARSRESEHIQLRRRPSLCARRRHRGLADGAQEIVERSWSLRA